MIYEIISTVHDYISGNVNTSIGKLFTGLWNIFLNLNGTIGSTNIGSNLAIMLFFSLFLILMLHLRAKLNFDKKHIVAYVGSMFLLVRVITLFIFNWGWEVGLYTDSQLYVLSPPLEHFFNTIFLGCFAYYTLITLNYYPGILKKILWYIPAVFLSLFIYSCVVWKVYFMEQLPNISNYELCMADWQNHILISIMSYYIFVVAIVKYKKYHCYISAFWTCVFITHFTKFISAYFGVDSSELTATLNAVNTWSLFLLIFHFINAYVTRWELPRERRIREIRNNNEIFIKCYDCKDETKGVLSNGKYSISRR